LRKADFEFIDLPGAQEMLFSTAEATQSSFLFRFVIDFITIKLNYLINKKKIVDFILF
jgi:hypothetical protein